MKMTVISDVLNIVCPNGEVDVKSPHRGEVLGGFSLLYDELASAECQERERRKMARKTSGSWR